MKKKNQKQTQEVKDELDECEIDSEDSSVDEQEEIQKEQESSSEDESSVEVELKESQRQVDELKNRLLRLQADFENYKKRSQKEKESIITYASEGLVTELLPALDNFERALSVDVDENSKSLYEGVEMVYNQILEVLKTNGLEEIECLNKKFDHNCHHAVVQQESDEHEEDTIMQVLGKGYKYKDKVIRPSMVMVSK